MSNEVKQNIAIFIIAFLCTFIFGQVAHCQNRHHHPVPREHHMWCFSAAMDHVIVNVCEPTQVECNLRRAQAGLTAGECAPRVVP